MPVIAPSVYLRPAYASVNNIDAIRKLANLPNIVDGRRARGLWLGCWHGVCPGGVNGNGCFGGTYVLDSGSGHMRHLISVKVCVDMLVRIQALGQVSCR